MARGALAAEEQPAAASSIDAAVAAEKRARSLHEKATAMDGGVGGFFAKTLAGAASRLGAGDVLLGNGAYGAATRAYEAAGASCQRVLDTGKTAPELLQALVHCRDLLGVLEMDRDDKAIAEACKAVEQAWQAAREQFQAGETKAAVEGVQAAGKLVERALAPDLAGAGKATLADAVGARADVHLAKAPLATDKELAEMVNAAGPSAAAHEAVLEVFEHARRLEALAERYVAMDAFAKAVFLFGRATQGYRRAREVQQKVMNALVARAGMLHRRRAAERASPGAFRPVRFEQALRRQQQADAKFREARYDEAAALSERVAELYEQAEAQGRLWADLFEAEKRRRERFARIDRAMLEQFAPAEFKSLQEEAAQIDVFRRANDAERALRRTDAVLTRLALIERAARAKQGDVAFVEAFGQAQAAVEAGDRLKAQQAVWRAAGLRPNDPSLVALATKAKLSLANWSFDDGLQQWVAESRYGATVWHHILDADATGGGCLRAGAPGQAAYGNRANTTLTSPTPVNLDAFAMPVLRFRHRVLGETKRDKIQVTVGGKTVWSKASSSTWSEATVPLAALKDKLTGPASVVFRFTSDTSKTGPGAYLDEVRIVDAGGD